MAESDFHILHLDKLYIQDDHFALEDDEEVRRTFILPDGGLAKEVTVSVLIYYKPVSNINVKT